MKKHFFLGASLLLLSAAQVFAQMTNQPTPTNNQTTKQTTTDAPDENNSDLVITANVRAKELKFEVVPTPTVTFPGTPARQTVWEADRTNLPQQVEPGVVYRDIGIRLRIYSRFAEIQRIVLEALDEPAPSTEQTPPTPAINSNTQPTTKAKKP